MESEPRFSRHLVYFMTMQWLPQPQLTAQDVIHQAALGYALGLQTDATGPLRIHDLPGLGSGARARLRARTLLVLTDERQRPRFGLQPRQVERLWDYGLVVRYAAQSLPALDGRSYASFTPAVPAAGPDDPPAGWLGARA